MFNIKMHATPVVTPGAAYVLDIEKCANEDTYKIRGTADNIWGNLWFIWIFLNYSTFFSHYTNMLGRSLGLFPVKWTVPLFYVPLFYVPCPNSLWFLQSYSIIRSFFCWSTNIFRSFFRISLVISMINDIMLPGLKLLEVLPCSIYAAKLISSSRSGSKTRIKNHWS